MSMVEFRNVTKAFDDLVVLRDLNFSIEKGEIVMVVGRPVRASQPCSAASTGWKR